MVKDTFGFFRNAGVVSAGNQISSTLKNIGLRIGGLAQARAADADTHLSRERTVLDLTIERGPAQTSSSQDRLDPQNSIVAVGRHKEFLHAARLLAF